jgi:hypothetical protein
VTDNNFQQKPVIFLAFAKKDEADSKDDLRHLPDEIDGIMGALKAAEKAGLCTVVEKAYVTIDTIFDVFQDERYRNRIAIFHFGGHANSYQLLLQDSSAYKEGLVPFLARQTGLTFVFLNGCSTARHALELTEAGIPAAAGTFRDISDKVATGLSIRFYRGIAEGLSLEEAWEHAVDFVKTGKGKNPSDYRRANWQGKRERQGEFPWVVEYKKEGIDNIKKWTLPGAAHDPLFGLPPIPKSYGFPKPPYRYLQRYERKHAKIFFGRSYFIRELYDKITGPGYPPVILLYGQSGVGKSSLLEAGLLPRIEGSHNVIYTRRYREKGLPGTLEEAVRDFLGQFFQKEPLAAGGKNKRHLRRDFDINNSSLEEKWKQIESQTGKPLVVLLDQAEEVFTDSNKDLPHELDDFMDVLKTIFKNPELYPKGKLILGYRKEFHAEIENIFKKKEFFDNASLFLEPLGRHGIIEVVTGLTRDAALRERYNLKVEKRLPIIIADDLSADKATPVATVLQIILTKMWEMFKGDGIGFREFTIDRYQTLRKQGIAMENFLYMQIEELEKWNKDVVYSGLALDILKYHTTKMGTACSRGIEELRSAYGNRHDILEELIKMEKKFYLLTETQDHEKKDKKEGTGLAHDILAPVVIKEYNESDRPGQRAARILAAKIGDFKRNKDKIWLDEADLEIVEQGRNGMKPLEADEEELLEISRERKVQREKVKKRIITIGVSLIILIFIFATFAAIQWKVAVEKTKEAIASKVMAEKKETEAKVSKKFAETQKSIAEKKATEAEANRLAVLADAKVKEDPTIALRIAEKAWRLDKNKIVSETIYKIYRENSFYKIIGKNKGSVLSVAISPDGNTILTGSSDDTARQWDRQGNVVQEFKGHENDVTSVAFSADGKTILTGSRDTTARLWVLPGNLLQEFKGHKNYVTSVAFSPDGKTILTGSDDKTARLWDLLSNMVQEFKGHKGSITSVAFSPDGKTILTGSRDNTARLWRVPPISLEDFLKKGI